MKNSYFKTSILLTILFLFCICSTFVIIEKNQYKTVKSEQTVTSLAVVSLENTEKIKLESYQANSDEKINVLITADDIETANNVLKSKGATTHKHNVGHVISADIPQNQIDSLADEDAIEQVLPNRAVQAFEINEVSETGAESFWNLGITGKGVVVAILDSGVNSDKVIASKNFVDSGTAQDENGHGTKIAEIILAMAPDVKIINAKVLDKDNLGSEASVIAGINYAIEQGADVISLSLGGLFNDINSPLVAAVEDAISKGVTVVAASGNCGNCGQCNGFVGVATPGNSPNAITVGAINGENSVCYSSGFNFGNYIKPDVVAPITNSLSGTSASTPFVSGAAALLIEKYNAKPGQVKSLIENNAKDLGDSGKDTVFGSGKLNLNFLTEEMTNEQIEFEADTRKEINEEKNIQGFGGCSVHLVDGNDSDIRTFDMGTSKGTFNVTYQTYVEKDQIVVLYENNKIFDSGCVGTNSWKTQTLNYSGTSTNIQVNVTSACGNESGTTWIYYVYCPVISAPQLYVPEVTLEQNTSAMVNLTQYSDGDAFFASGICSINGEQLIVNPPQGFTGFTTCQVNATKNAVPTTQQVGINVIPAGPIADLAISQSDIQIIPSGTTEDINLTVHNIGRTSSSPVNIKLIELFNNKITQTKTDSIGSIENKSSETKLISMDITRGSTIAVVVDYDNTVTEYSEANNKAEAKYSNLDVYLNFTIQSEFEEAFITYLRTEFKGYNIVNNINDAEIILNIAYNAGDKTKGCNAGIVYFNGKSVSDIHTGLIFAKDKTVNVCAARIEGLVNAIKRLNKNNLEKNKDMFFDRSDLGAISIRDFFNKKVLNADLVKQALNGPLEQTDDYVQTNDGTYLRLKHYKPIVSQSFLDYLFDINVIDGAYLPPVIMAGGLWADITAWDEAGREIASGVEDNAILSDSVEYAPRDVWLIELTGGSGTECDSCDDYTYDNLTDKYWPAAVGGVLKLTGRTEAAYVGHSNGGRVALDAMAKYNTIKSTTSYLSNGTAFNLPSSNPITTFIGVGVPGAFEGDSKLRTVMLKIAKATSSEMDAKKHISYADILGFAKETATQTSLNKISVNVWKKYFDFMNLTTDIQPGNVILSKTLMIAGTLLGTNDEIIPVNDVDAIWNKIGVKTGGKKVLMHVWDGHLGMTETWAIKTAVKEFLNDDPLSGNIINQVNG